MMEKVKNCEDCDRTFTYEAPTNYPDRRKYCPTCSAAKKAEWDNRSTTDKYAQHGNDVPNVPIRESEKIVDTPKATLMPPREVGMCAGGMLKCWYYNHTAENLEEIYDNYHKYVKMIEENG